MRQHVLLEIIFPLEELVANGAQVVLAIGMGIALDRDSVVVIVIITAAAAVVVGVATRIQQRRWKRGLSGQGRVGIDGRGLMRGQMLSQETGASKDYVTNAADVRVRGHGRHVISDTDPFGLLERECAIGEGQREREFKMD